MMLVYAMSIAMLTAPLAGYWIVISRYSARTKLFIAVAGTLLLVLAPIAAMWLFGGGES